MKKRTINKGKNNYFTNSNNRILAENPGNTRELDIWLDLSGERHYLMRFRRNPMLYMLLKDSISLGELVRWRPVNAAFVRRCFGGLSMRQIDKITHSVWHVRNVAEVYIAEMQENDGIEPEIHSIADVPLTKKREREPAA